MTSSSVLSNPVSDTNPQRVSAQALIMSEQFTVAGQSIPTITTAYGGFLILWGIVFHNFLMQRHSLLTSLHLWEFHS